jgi:hypothetical protein
MQTAIAASPSGDRETCILDCHSAEVDGNAFQLVNILSHGGVFSSNK